MRKHLIVYTVLACVLAASGVIIWRGAARGSRATRPNVILLLTDDQRWDSMADLPATDAMGGWRRFDEAFVNDPQCCPSRATILTGRLTQNTGVETLRDGGKLDERQTVATMLHAAGYRTGFFGKYLNGYPFGRGHYVPPGWDRFVAYEGATNYFKYRLNEDGKAHDYGSAARDYSTDVFADQVRSFIRHTDGSDPFFLDVAFNAPHTPIVAAPRHVGSCARRPVQHRPAFNQPDRVQQPSWMSGLRPLNPAVMDTQVRHTCAALHGVDEAVTSIFGELRRAGRLDNTYVIFMSDNGYSFGEHRLVGKGHLYEESIRVPLLVRGPHVEAGATKRLTSNADVLPTILEWAGVSAPRASLDGTSFAATARGDRVDGPREVLLRGCRTSRTLGSPVGEEGATCGGYLDGGHEMGLNWGLRTARYKLIEYPDGSLQLFDLVHDPDELVNLAPEAGRAPVIADLRARLARLRRRR